MSNIKARCLSCCRLFIDSAQKTRLFTEFVVGSPIAAVGFSALQHAYPIRLRFELVSTANLPIIVFHGSDKFSQSDSRIYLILLPLYGIHTTRNLVRHHI